MKFARTVVNAMVVAAIGFGAAEGVGAASAQPGAPMPLKPAHEIDQPCFPFCEEGHGRNDDFQRGDWNNVQQGNWDNKGPWWANNSHDWWDDRQGPPPWGWGPPPAYQWNGGPPRPFNYWGYNVNPVWDDGFHQWGIRLFGLWIPIIGIGIT